MPKQKFQYSVAYKEKDRNLTKKEIIFLRKLCRTNGRKLVDDIRENPGHKFREFFLDVWQDYTHGDSREGFQASQCWEALCEVEPGTFKSYWLDRGVQQKRTYRTNRFEETIDHASRSMSKGSWTSMPVLWRINTDLNHGSDYDSRVRDVSSYVVANNREEAATVWETMVLNPLAIKPKHGVDARFIGPASHFSFVNLNNRALEETKLEIQRKREKLEGTLEQLKKTQTRSEFAFALINQTLAMVEASESPES